MTLPGLASLTLFAVLITALLYLSRQLKRARARIRLLESLNTEKDKLFTVIGHDLNGFVNMGQAGLQLYRSGDLPVGEGQLILDGLEEKFYTASVTLQSLLNWGKSVFKGVAINPVIFDATAIIRTELELATAATRTKDLTIVNAVPVDLHLYADPDHFTFIIRNLVSNALKFSRTGGAIKLSLTPGKEKGVVVIAVTDSGVGMSAEKLKKVFNPFGSSTDGTAQEKGNGIGLLLCREYARQNGGDLWAESTGGVGTTFFMAVKQHH